MTIKVIQQRLAGLLFPKAWENQFPENVTTDTPFILDIVPTDDCLDVFLSFHALKNDFHKNLHFGIDNQPLEIIEQREIPRGLCIKLSCSNADSIKKVSITQNEKTVQVKIEPNPFQMFKGLNTAFLTEVEPDPVAFQNWLAYHCDNHGLQAVVMLRRCNKNWSKKNIANQLKKAAQKTNGLEAFALFDSNLPLGHPNLPSIQDRLTTPDGPGKALLAPPELDPYESALYEFGILEAVLTRSFISSAAVVYMGMSDLLTRRPQSETIFDAAKNSETYIKTTGLLAYPFSYRKPKKPHFADHTCISFDGKKGGSIWAVGQEFMKKQPAFRPFRVSTAAPDPKSTEFSYWRCMGMRYPKLKIGQLVPKASLVLNDELCQNMSDYFDHDPKNPPLAQKSNKQTNKNQKILIVTTMKNEGPFILEWLAYHMSIGFTDFIVYTNDCTDGTDTMFDLLDRKGFLEHRQNPYRETGQKPQHAAYLEAQTTKKAKDADWIICMDVDEYINIHVGDGTVHDLFAAVPDANMFALTWRLFGNSEVDLFEDKFITQQFFRCAPQICRKPHQAWGFKTLFRNNGYYKKFGVHRPVGLLPEFKNHINWVNGSGEKMPENILRTGWRSTTKTWGYDLVTLNHYALRSCESFLVKRDRGRVNHVDRDQGMSYWFRMNNNGEQDYSITNKLIKAQEKYNELMADDEIAQQHQSCVRAHRQRITELKERPDYMEMYETLKSERMIKLSRLHSHFGSAIFLEGPDAVPLDTPLLANVKL